MINWIKVEDRLPERDLNNHTISIDVLYMDKDKNFKIGWYDFTYGVFDYDYGYENRPSITHWAYLSDINLPIE